MQQDGFGARWQHFSPLDTVYVQNPFNDTVQWEVANDRGSQDTYTIKPHSRATLPGGLIATLGVKKMVDRLIMEDNKDPENVSMFDPAMRQGYQDRVVLRIKAAPGHVTSSTPRGQVIDLTAGAAEKAAEDRPQAAKKVETPSAQPPPGQGETYELSAQSELNAAKSSLPKEDLVDVK